MKSFTIRLDNSFEAEVFRFINSKCNKKECVYQEYSSDKSRIRYDLYLPHGCKALNISSRTAIEIKLRISYNTLERCKHLYNIAIMQPYTRHLMYEIKEHLSEEG